MKPRGLSGKLCDDSIDERRLNNLDEVVVGDKKGFGGGTFAENVV